MLIDLTDPTSLTSLTHLMYLIDFVLNCWNFILVFRIGILKKRFCVLNMCKLIRWKRKIYLRISIMHPQIFRRICVSDFRWMRWRYSRTPYGGLWSLDPSQNLFVNYIFAFPFYFSISLKSSPSSPISIYLHLIYTYHSIFSSFKEQIYGEP